MPRGLFQADGVRANGAVLFSVRPHGISLHRGPGAAPDPMRMQARLLQRAYLGQYWDYVVSPLDSGIRLKVAAAPSELFEVGETLWLKLDPQQMVPIEA